MLTLDGITEPAPEAVLKELAEATVRAQEVAAAYWQNEKNRPPASLASRVLTEKESLKVREKSFEVCTAMFYDGAEVRMFTAERRRLLAEYGFDDNPAPARLTLKAQPERLGALLVATFNDRLACVDPKRWLDAHFVPEGEMMEAWWLFHAPKQGVKRWLAKRKAEGRPWEPKEAAASPKTTVTWEELKRVRAVLYPQGVKDTASGRRFLTPSEAQEAYRAAYAEINGEPPHAISMLMKLDVDNLTPVQALSTLKHLQDVARRRDFGPKLLDSP